MTVTLLIPECGAWWGVYTRPPAGPADWAAGTRLLERQVGRRFDLVSRYQWWDAVIPDQSERDLASDGH